MLGAIRQELPEGLNGEGATLEGGSKVFDDPQPGSKVSHVPRASWMASNCVAPTSYSFHNTS